MAITKSAIKELLQENNKVVFQKIDGVETKVDSLGSTMRDGFSEMKDEFKNQRQAIDRGFEDTKDIMAQTYATKEEVEELRTEVDDLRKELEGFRRMYAQK